MFLAIPSIERFSRDGWDRKEFNWARDPVSAVP
jgi:hypothetical protein